MAEPRDHAGRSGNILDFGTGHFKMLLVRWFHVYAQVWPTKKHPRRQLRHSGTGEQGGAAGRCPTSSSAQEHWPPPCAPDTLSRPTGDHLVSPPCSGSGAQSHPHSTHPSVHTLPPARLPLPTNPHKVVSAGMTKPFLSGIIYFARLGNKLLRWFKATPTM